MKHKKIPGLHFCDCAILFFSSSFLLFFFYLVLGFVHISLNRSQLAKMKK